MRFGTGSRTRHDANKYLILCTRHKNGISQRSCVCEREKSSFLLFHLKIAHSLADVPLASFHRKKNVINPQILTSRTVELCPSRVEKQQQESYRPFEFGSASYSGMALLPLGLVMKGHRAWSPCACHRCLCSRNAVLLCFPSIIIHLTRGCRVGIETRVRSERTE